MCIPWLFSRSLLKNFILKERVPATDCSINSDKVVGKGSKGIRAASLNSLIKAIAIISLSKS